MMNEGKRNLSLEKSPMKKKFSVKLNEVSLVDSAVRRYSDVVTMQQKHNDGNCKLCDVLSRHICTNTPKTHDGRARGGI